MKQFLDFLPLVVFFAFYKIYDIYAATAGADRRHGDCAYL
ncbi:septation protein IspZ [Escherichia coli]